MNLRVLFSFLIVCMAYGEANAADPMPSFIGGKQFDTVSLQLDGQFWPASFSISDTIDPESPSTMDLPGLGCLSNLFAIESDEERVVFKQRLATGQGVCTDLGYVLIRKDIAAEGPIFEFSPTRALHPVYTAGALVESNLEIGEETLLELARRSVDPGKYAQILGTWEDTTWLTGRGCHLEMAAESIDWLPSGSKGRLIVWAVTTDAGGRVFAAWVKQEVGEYFLEPVPRSYIAFTELKHWTGRVFEARDGILDREGPVLLAPSRDRDTGKTILTVRSVEDDSVRDTELEYCEGPK